MALIYVCKQIHAEAFDAMHKSLRFVCFTNVTKVKNFPTVLPSMRPPCLQVQLIKDLTLHIFLTAQAIEAMYGSSSVPQTTFPHLSAFESLKVLRLCVGSDYGSIFFGRSHNAPGLQTPMILVRVKNLLSVLVGATPSGVRLVPLEEHEYPLFHPTGGCYMSTALLCGALAELRRDWALSRLARAPNNEKKALEKECKEASEALRMMEEEWKKIKAERARVEAELEIEAELEMKALEKELKQANEALRMTEDESKNVKAERARVEADLALKRGVSGPTVIDLTGGGD